MQEKQTNGLTGLVSKLVGVEQGPAFDMSRFFGSVFVRHTEAELDEFLCQGEGTTPPPPPSGWPAPWVFSRVLILGVLTALFAYLCGCIEPNNLHTVPLKMFAYSALIPLGVTVLLFELNIKRSISIFTALKVFLAGGAVSMVLSAFFYDALANTAISRALGNSDAGIVEEVVKLAAVLLFVKTVRRCSNVLEGIALGALVGLGFAVFESMGYYFRIFLLELLRNTGATAQVVLQNALASAESNAVLRAWSSPYGHMMFSAIVVGGLFLVKGDRPFALNMLWDGRFLRIASVAVLCHMFWDSNFLSSSMGFVIKLSLIAILEIATLIVLAGHGLQTAAGGGTTEPSPRPEEEAAPSSKQSVQPTNAVPVKWLVIIAAAWFVFDYSQNGKWIWERKSGEVRQTQTQPVQQPTAPTQPSGQNPTRQPAAKKTTGASVVKLKMPRVNLQKNCQSDPYGRFRINGLQTATIMPMPPSGAIMTLPPTSSGFAPNVNVVTETSSLAFADYATQFELARVNEGAVIRGRNADSKTHSFAILFELNVKGMSLVSYCRVYANGISRYAVSGVCAKADWNTYAAKLQNCVNSFTLNGKRGAK